MKIAENGEISLICGRATSMARRVWRRLGSSAEFGMQRVLLPGLVLGLVHGALRLAADLAERYAGYDGPWGLRLTGIRNAIAYEYVQGGDEGVVQPYDADNYQKTVTAHTSDLRATPEAVTEQLVGALLRGLSVDKVYLPYVKTESGAPSG